MNDVINSFGTRPKYVNIMAPAGGLSMMCCHAKIMIFTKTKPRVIMGKVRVGILSLSGIIRLFLYHATLAMSKNKQLELIYA